MLAIVVLLVFILWLGQPASRNNPGGILAQKRQELNLSQSTLGDVEPSSAIMKVVLLGFRGVAADLLWVQAKEQEKKKEWGKYRATTNTILLLQPNFEDVWRYTGWDFSYNVSSQWDDVKDRYYWLKEGGKFLREGADQNQYSAAIQWDIGRVLGQKIGLADERNYFREYFRHDPDPQFEGETDLSFNPKGINDNYLAAKQDFIIANDREEEFGQNIMKSPLFRISATKSVINAASAMQREGVFDRPRQLWSDAREELLGDEFGKYNFYSQEGHYNLMATDEEIEKLAIENSETVGREIKPKDIKNVIEYFKTQSQFDYWLLRCEAEQDEITMKAHEDVYLGKKKFQEADWDAAMEYLQNGMKGFDQVIKKYPSYVLGDTEKLDEVLESVLYWSFIYENSPKYGLKPATYPLKDLWDQNLEHIIGLNQRFRIDNQLN
ncbi:hypothetical protein [Polystyrenella longa]|nr:hypothetical protein [Polystyrenella longa]